MIVFVSIIYHIIEDILFLNDLKIFCLISFCKLLCPHNFKRHYSKTYIYIYIYIQTKKLIK